MTLELWVSIGTVLATVVLVVVPGVVYAWYVLEEWIGPGDRYPEV